MFFFLCIIELFVKEARAKIEKNRLEKIAKIEENRRDALAKLNIRYETADKVKTSFGIIGILFNVLTWGCIILNDLVKLFKFLYDETKEPFIKRQKQEKIKNREREESKREKEQVILEMEEYNHIKVLENKLDQVHLQLLKVCARRARQKLIEAKDNY